MSKITRLSDKTNNAAMMSPVDALNDAIKEFEEGKRGAFEFGKKVIIIVLDDTADNFEVNWMQAGMNMSECLSVCEVAKTQFLNAMGYID